MLVDQRKRTDAHAQKYHLAEKVAKLPKYGHGDSLLIMVGKLEQGSTDHGTYPI